MTKMNQNIYQVYIIYSLLFHHNVFSHHSVHVSCFFGRYTQTREAVHEDFGQFRLSDLSPLCFVAVEMSFLKSLEAGNPKCSARKWTFIIFRNCPGRALQHTRSSIRLIAQKHQLLDDMESRKKNVSWDTLGFGEIQMHDCRRPRLWDGLHHMVQAAVLFNQLLNTSKECEHRWL